MIEYLFKMTSVERILEYTNLDQEPLDIGKEKPPKSWPQSGHIRFENVSFRYAKNMPFVLNDLSFEIKPNEKIGVVGKRFELNLNLKRWQRLSCFSGRTGAGKSSIIQALFRMSEPDGSVLIDGFNIKDMSLHELREKLSIIPVNKN